MKFDFGSLGETFEATWPVKVSVPVTGGKVQEQTFDVVFRLVDDEELSALGEGVDAQKAALRMVVVDVPGETFTPELFELMLARPYVRSALNLAYGQFVVGIPVKNSKTPRD